MLVRSNLGMHKNTLFQCSLNISWLWCFALEQNDKWPCWRWKIYLGVKGSGCACCNISSQRHKAISCNKCINQKNPGKSDWIPTVLKPRSNSSSIIEAYWSYRLHFGVPGYHVHSTSGNVRAGHETWRPRSFWLKHRNLRLVFHGFYQDVSLSDKTVSVSHLTCKTFQTYKASRFEQPICQHDTVAWDSLLFYLSVARAASAEHFRRLRRLPELTNCRQSIGLAVSLISTVSTVPISNHLDSFTPAFNFSI